MKIQITKLPKNRYDIGGVLQSHGSDWSDGLVTIGAGGSHEENKYQGVQVGVDTEGTPNLVEEGETIYNDYVYSNRITLDDEAKKAFHIGKKRDITYADLSKKLEKEAAERPNDPISQAALQAQMADLADEQERQKQEMEAAKAQAAFESLTPEEKVGVMQYAQQQDQMAQEQAMQEQMMAQQYAQEQQPMGLEEAAMMQQQQMPMQGQPILGAYGGKLFLGGGDLFNRMYSYTAGKGYSDKIRREIAQAMVNRAIAKYGSMNSIPDSVSARYFYNDFLRGFDASEEGYRRNYNDMRSSGMSQAAATAYLQTERGTAFKKNNETNYDARLAWERKAADWENRRAMATDTSKKNSSKPVYGTSKNGLHTKTVDGKTWYRGADAQYYADERQALATRNQATPKEEKKEEVAAPKQEAAASEASTPKAVAPKTGGNKISTASNGVNAGTWKTGTSADYWNKYTKEGLKNYLRWINSRLKMSDSEEERENIRQDAINTVAEIQQLYKGAYQSNLTPSKENETVRALQTAFQKANGNAYFDGIENDIILPRGHNTNDRKDKKWIDGLWGPRTSIRNWGSTEYGDFDYKDIADLASQAGLVYAPNTEWTYGAGDNSYQLYGLSRATTDDEVFPENVVNYGDPEAVAAAEDYGAVDNFVEIDADGNPTKPATVVGVEAAGKNDGYDVEPIHRSEIPRYAGLFGPAAGLLMQGFGFGRPDTNGLQAVLTGYDKTGVSNADYRPIGNYLRYVPMDVWAAQNRMDANTRASERILMNTTSPSKWVNVIANNYASQLGNGELHRQSLEYNDANALKKGEFNRGTDMFNAQAYNQTSQFNASQRERDRQLRAQLGMQAAMQKADMDAAWYNGIYGNVAGLFKGIGDLGRENAQHNMIADMAATGIFGTIKNQPIANGYVRVVPKKNEAAKGGKVCRKKGKRGLTF